MFGAAKKRTDAIFGGPLQKVPPILRQTKLCESWVWDEKVGAMLLGILVVGKSLLLVTTAAGSMGRPLNRMRE